MRLPLALFALCLTSVAACAAENGSNEPVRHDEPQTLSEGANDVAEDAGYAAGKVTEGVKDATTAIGHGARDTTKAIGHGARETTKTVGHETRNFFQRIGDGISDGWHAATD